MQLDGHVPGPQLGYDRPLHAGVDNGDPWPRALEDRALDAAHPGDQISAKHRRLRLDQSTRLALAHPPGKQSSAHGTLAADMAHQRPRGDLGYRRHSASL